MPISRLGFLTLIVVAAVAGCKSSTSYEASATGLVPLKVSFADASWDGKSVPSGQECSRYGGHGATPALVVSNIPAGANAIIVSFNDASYQPLSTDGGHGKIGFWIDGGGTKTLPSVPGGSDAMPEGAFVEAKNRARGNTPGYLPPCSGGRGNSYFADVMAVYKAKNESEPSKLLGEGRIELGKY